MSGDGIEIRGLDAAFKAIEKYGPANRGRMFEKATRAAAAATVVPIRAEAPVSPHGSHGKPRGTLRRSVSVRKALQGREHAYSVAARAFYRGFVIRGTRRGVHPNPFVDRGLTTAGSRIRAAIVKVLGEPW